MQQLEKIYEQYMYSYPHKTAYHPLPKVKLESYLKRLEGKEETLYFHLPFCETKCGYCNLFSIVGKDEAYFDQYIQAMKRQCEQYALKESVSFKNLVVGGGTPLLLSTRQLQEVFELAKTYGHTDVKEAYSIIETSPNQTTKEKVDYLKEVGMKRVSLGVQSFHEAELEQLQRRHTPVQARHALQLLKAANFESLNIDLIYGIAGQTLASLQYSLECALSYEPDEIFIYPLYIQEGTGLSLGGQKPHLERYTFYKWLSAYLIKEGYHQTSMRRFARHKGPSQVPCGFDRTLAIGCGGRSYIDDLHFCSPYARSQKQCRKEVEAYCQETDYKKITNGYLLNEEEQRRRFVIKHLLYHEGIPKAFYESTYKRQLEADFPVLQALQAAGYIEEKGTFKESRLQLTPKGLGYSDAIGPLFISPGVEERMAQWHEG